MYYILNPLVAIGTLMLILAPNDESLIVAAFLRGFDTVSRIVIVGSITPELISPKYIGRWRGILGLFGGLASIVAPIVGGLLWEVLGPAYIFLIVMGLDLLVTLPLITQIPETLVRFT